ncbi:hypothetical protein ACEPAI_3460 [Sanghuangporus weigelae]
MYPGPCLISDCDKEGRSTDTTLPPPLLCNLAKFITASIIPPLQQRNAKRTLNSDALPPTPLFINNYPGRPSTFPRDPRVTLDHLNDKADTSATDSTAANNGSILVDAAREDWRYAVDVASQYLPGTVAGAFGYDFPFGTTKPEEAQKKLQAGRVGQQTPFELDPKDLALGGIVSDFNPSSSRSRASKSESEPSSNKYAVAAFTTVPASKEQKKDDDVQEVSTRQSQSQSSDLRKRATETAALGAGVGTLGGRAYGSSRSPAQPSSNEQSAKGHPAFATYAPAPVITDTSSEDAARPTASAKGPSRPSEQAPSASTSVWDERGRSDTEKALHPHRAGGTDTNGEDKKKAIEAAALGAGIGTVGGATYAHSHSSKDTLNQVSPTGTAQPQVSGDKLEDILSAKARGTDPTVAGAPGGDVAVAPAGYAETKDETSPTVKESPVESETRSHTTRDTQEDADQDVSRSDAKTKKRAEDAAVGAEAGILGGAAYAHSRTSGQDPYVDSSTSTSSPTALSRETPSNFGAPTDSQAQPASKPTAPSTDTSGPEVTQKAP